MSWNVWPPLIRIAAIPLDAVARMILPWERITDRIKLMRNIFPALSGASRNIMLPAKQCTVGSGTEISYLIVTYSPGKMMFHLKQIVTKNFFHNKSIL